MLDTVTKELGPVDVLVNNAGVCFHRPAADVPDDEWRAVRQIPAAERRADRDTWIGECEAASAADARRFVETQLAQLPRYVPKLKIVDLHD